MNFAAFISNLGISLSKWEFLHICLGIKFRIYLGHIWENVSPLKFGTLDMR